ncbi:protein kinase [bacterium]|nr:protein kinase [bacterium]
MELEGGRRPPEGDHGVLRLLERRRGYLVVVEEAERSSDVDPGLEFFVDGRGQNLSEDERGVRSYGKPHRLTIVPTLRDPIEAIPDEREVLPIPLRDRLRVERPGDRVGVDRGIEALDVCPHEETGSRAPLDTELRQGSVTEGVDERSIRRRRRERGRANRDLRRRERRRDRGPRVRDLLRDLEHESRVRQPEDPTPGVGSRERMATHVRHGLGVAELVWQGGAGSDASACERRRLEAGGKLLRKVAATEEAPELNHDAPRRGQSLTVAGLLLRPRGPSRSIAPSAWQFPAEFDCVGRAANGGWREGPVRGKKKGTGKSANRKGTVARSTSERSARNPRAKRPKNTTAKPRKAKKPKAATRDARRAKGRAPTSTSGATKPRGRLKTETVGEAPSMSDTSFRQGRYQVVSVLGRSHYATVYEAHDRTADERVAVKVLSLAGTHREIADAMFRKEVGALTGFEHPAVVRLLDHFAEPDANRLGIVLELVPGGKTLETMISDVEAGRAPRRTLRWRLEQLTALLDGLGSAHRRNVVHRDVKLANVLVNEQHDVLKLADFGIARLLENYGRGEGSPTLREFYTRPFAAPEQVLRGDATFASDLHAFGLVAACLLAWRVPPPDFAASELPRLVEQLRHEVRDPGAFDEVERSLGALLAPDPAHRPRLHEVARLLRSLLDRVGERASVPIRLTKTARDRARENGCPTEAAALHDLNDGLRARYEPASDRRTGAESFTIRCYGKGLWAQLLPDDVDPHQLAVVNVGRNPPNIHANHRERALAVPLTLTVGNGSAAALVDPLFAEYQAERRRDEERRQKESLLAVAQFILARQRRRLLSLKVRYHAPGHEPVGVPGGPSPEAPTSTIDARGDFIGIRVLAVEPTDDAAEASDDLAETWTDRLDERSPFFLGGDKLGTFHAYDRDTAVLSIRLSGRRRVPRDGELECKDIALDTALRRQEKALYKFFDDDCANPRLGRLLLHPEENRLGEILPRDLFQDLEPRQEMQALVERALAAEDCFLVQGPPGTGKTTFIAEVVAQILTQRPDARILLTSQANEAVDNALSALRDVAKKRGVEWRLLRDVSADRADKGAMATFEETFREWVARTRERSRKALAEATHALEPTKLAAIQKALARWTERLDRAPDVKQDYAESVQVFGVTCLRVPRLWEILREVQFDWVVVDEAAKATPAEILVPLVVGKRFVLVGDHRQLPPFLDTETEQDVVAADMEVERARRSLFEDLFGRIPETNRRTLRRQYRMHRSIGEFVGKLYYEDVGGLETGVTDSERTLAIGRFDRPNRVFWIDVNGSERTEGTSYWNQAEADAIHALLKRADQELRGKAVGYTVAVIAPYAAQVRRLQQAVLPGARSWSALTIRIATVDAFQGKQDDLVVYSMVRTGGGEKRFLSDRRRLNVAFSRAKRLLLVVGHKASAERSPELLRAINLIPRENVLAVEDAP